MVLKWNAGSLFYTFILGKPKYYEGKVPPTETKLDRNENRFCRVALILNWHEGNSGNNLCTEIKVYGVYFSLFEHKQELTMEIGRMKNKFMTNQLMIELVNGSQTQH